MNIKKTVFGMEGNKKRFIIKITTALTSLILLAEQLKFQSLTTQTTLPFGIKTAWVIIVLNVWVLLWFLHGRQGGF